MFELISKLSIIRGIGLALIVFGIFLAPYWFIFQFAHDVYKENQIIQTAILVLSVGSPITFINVLFVFFIKYFSQPAEIETESIALDVEGETQRFYTLMSFTCGFTGFIWYVPYFVKVLFGRIVLHNAISIVVLIELGIIVPLFLRLCYLIVKEIKQKKKDERIDRNNLDTGVVIKRVRRLF